MDVQAGSGGVDPLAETQDNALFRRLHTINASRDPTDYDEHCQDSEIAPP